MSHYRNNNFNNLTSIQNQANRQFNASLVPVEVRNWDGATKDELVAFVSRKARIALQNAYVDQPSGAIFAQVRSKQEADSLLEWSGVRFAGKPLKFSKKQEGSEATSGTIDLLKRFLKKRYNPEQKLLDLTNIASDAELQSNGAFSSISTQSKMFPALMKLASTEKFDVESVNLSSNNLQDINGITTLSSTFPNLKNLALSNNSISRTKSLEIWKNKFKSLRELILVNNPITTQPSYVFDILKTFPRLVILDGNVIRDESKLNQIYQLPVSKKQFFFEDTEIQNLSTQFISNFFQLWDTDRSQLVQLYTNESQFSISVDTSVPNDAPASQIAFGYYIPISRNLTRVSSDKLRDQRLGKGSQEIFKIFQNLPKSKHKITENPNLYSMESWRYQQVNGFIISFHGEFDETSAPELDSFSTNSTGPRGHRRGAITSSTSNKLTPKSFDRTFVIVPNGTGLVIASDLLIIRPIANSQTSWIEETQQQIPTQTEIPQTQQPQQLPPSSANPTPPPSSSMQLPPGVTLTLEQEQILQKLLVETKLNLEFSLLLAQQSGWNYEIALNGFKQSHLNGQIPPNAFQ